MSQWMIRCEGAASSVVSHTRVKAIDELIAFCKAHIRRSGAHRLSVRIEADAAPRPWPPEDPFDPVLAMHRDWYAQRHPRRRHAL